MNIEDITFAKATKKDENLMKSWWNKPHVVEFWDTSPEMWANFINFINGQGEIFDYWIGYYKQDPFCLIMTSVLEPEIVPDDPYPIDHIIPWMDPKRLNLGFDLMIGEEAYLGKGLSYLALRQFIKTLSSKPVTFFIDPATNNAKAVHVYKKAGFDIISTFISKTGSNKGLPHYLMKATNATPNDIESCLACNKQSSD